MNLEVTHLFENSHGTWYLGVAVNGHDLGELVHRGLGEVEWQSFIQETSRTSSSMISTPPHTHTHMLLPGLVLGHGETSQRGS